MPFTLVSRGTVLGHTGAELTGLQPDARGWHFLPAPAFEAVRPTFIALQAAGAGVEELMPTDETLATVREPERATFVRNALMSDPGAGRFLELMDEVESLQLVLQADDGSIVATRTLGVTELELTPAAFQEMLQAIDPDADPRLASAPPFYLLVAGV